VEVTGNCIIINTELRKKYCFKCTGVNEARRWLTDINTRSAEIKESTLRTKKVYEDSLAHIKAGTHVVDLANNRV
jgi:hypothetical protein